MQAADALLDERGETYASSTLARNLVFINRPFRSRPIPAQAALKLTRQVRLDLSAHANSRDQTILQARLRPQQRALVSSQFSSCTCTQHTALLHRAYAATSHAHTRKLHFTAMKAAAAKRSHPSCGRLSPVSSSPAQAPAQQPRIIWRHDVNSTVPVPPPHLPQRYLPSPLALLCRAFATNCWDLHLPNPRIRHTK